MARLGVAHLCESLGAHARQRHRRPVRLRCGARRQRYRHRPALQPHRAFGRATLGLWDHRSSAWVLRGRERGGSGTAATTDALVAPATLAGGIGSALLILLWCEIYSCLSPTRVALYYALAIIGGVVLTFALQGFSDEYLYGALLVLPALSAALAHRSYRLYVPAEDRPIAANRRLIPWKFFLILALFELVASYSSAHIRSAYPLLVGSHSTATTLVGGLVLFAWVWWFSNRLPLSALYRAPVILLCCGLLIVPLFGLGGNLAGSFCTALGVMLFNAIVFLFLCDISKRFGVSALLLFGHRGVADSRELGRPRGGAPLRWIRPVRRHGTGHRCRSRHCGHCGGGNSRA